MGDIVWHGHHENVCPLEELDGTIEERRQQIIAEKPAGEHELRLRLLRLASPEAVEAWAAYHAALAPAWRAFDEVLALDQAAYVAYDAAVAAWAAAYDAAVATALRPILALHAIECPDCPWDGHSIFGGTA